MQKLKYLFLMIFFYQSTIMAQNVVASKYQSEVTAAIVYLDGAEVIRNKVISLKAGKNEIIFEGLSSKLNAKTIQVYAPKGVDILSITNKINYLSVDQENPKIQSLIDSVELLQLSITALNDEKGAYHLEKDLLVSNKSIGGEEQGVSIADLKEAADFYRNRLLEINRKLSKIAHRLQINNKELSKLKRQLNEVNSKNSIQRSEIAVLLASKTAMKAPVELRYLVNEVGWIPAYDIKAAGINEPIQLIYRAKVYNNTDIQWNNVKLTLSSADPTINASKPNLQPWYLSYKQSSVAPQNAYSNKAVGPSRQSIAPSPQSFMDNASSRRELQQLNSQQGGSVFQKGALTFTNIAISDINAEFKIEEKYSIPSDAKPYFIKIKEYQLEATFKHYSVPKERCDAFLLARITGWEDLDILEGTANIYLNGTYTGQSFINTRGVNDTLDISLGKDSKVVVNRKKQMEFSSTKLIGSNQKETFTYEITVRNNHKVPVNIEIIDQLPVPQDSDIEVDKLELSDGEHNELTGMLKWNLNVESTETEKINFSFAIKFPKNKPINTKRTKFRTVRYL